MKFVFALTTGRSGTHFLYHLARRNLRDATCRHETNWEWGNPSLFGPAIDASTRGDRPFVRQLVEKKRRAAVRYGTPVYFESSHSFLKSYYNLAPEYFDEIKVFHLVRDPLQTALSETNREVMLDRIFFPGHRYRSVDGRRYFRWSLTGKEEIYRSYRGRELTLFQRYLLQWIEIQNRAIEFLNQFDLNNDCVTLHSTRDLNDAETMKEAFGRLNLDLKGPEIEIAGRRNRTFGFPTRVTVRERQQARDVLATLPQRYLTVFHSPRFARFAWTRELLNRYAEQPAANEAAVAVG